MLKNWHKNPNILLSIAVHLLAWVEFITHPESIKFIVYLYFIQSIFIGIGYVIKILLSKRESDIGMHLNFGQILTSILINSFTAFFFVIHFGIFLLFLGGIGFVSVASKFSGGWGNFVLPATLCMAVGLVLSLPKEIKIIREKNISKFALMFVPYTRLFPFILLFFTEINTNKPSDSLNFTLFMILKTALDVVYFLIVERMYKMETSKPNSASAGFF